MTQPDGQPSRLALIGSSRMVEKILLTVGAVSSFWIFWTVANLFDVPRDRGYQASLLGEPSAVLALLMAGVVLVACVMLTSFFTGFVEFEGGLFCAMAGLLALSVRGGPIRYTLMASPGDGVFLRFIVETLILFAFLAAGWYVLLILRDRGLIRERFHDEPDAHDALPGQRLMALAAQVVVTTFLMILLAQSDKKAQVVWAVMASSTIAAVCAHSLFPARPSPWFWTAPLIVAVIGYALALLGHGNHLPGGAVGGFAPPLARPLPLDYASVGPAGALFGYWISRRWQHEKDEEPEEPGEVENRLEHPPATA